MKYLFLIILFSILIFSCNKQDDKSEWDKLKFSNDFMAIENFIVQNPDTEHLHEGVRLIFKLKKQKDDTTQIPTYPNYYGRNATRIIINTNSALEIISETFNGKADLKDVRQLSKNYFKNGQNHPDLPELKEVSIKNKEIFISKGHFYLVIDTTAQIDTLKKVVRSLSESLSDYKQYILKKYFAEDTNYPDQRIIGSLDSLLKNRIWIFDIKEHEETLPKKIKTEHNNT